MARKPKQDVEQNAGSDHIRNEAVADKPTQFAAKAEQEKNAPEDGATKFVEAEYRSRCGGALRLAREKQNLTTRDIANQLRLSVKQIEAIESDNFAALPEPTIVKGFIKNYAKLLKIPVEPLLDAYLVIVPNKAHHSLAIQPASAMRLNDSGNSAGSGRYLWMLFAVLLAVGLWFFYQGYIQKPSPVQPTTELKEPLPEAALPMAERNNPSDEVVSPNVESPAEAGAVAQTVPASGAVDSVNAQADTASSNNATPNNAATGNKAAETKSLIPEPATDNMATEKRPVNTQNYRLEFNASQETWVSIVDATDKEVYNKILFPGNREVIEAKPPLKIVVGNSHGATLTVNNEAVDLAPHTRINVARLRLD